MSPAATDIFYVITDLQRGGVPLHLRRLVGAVRKEGYRVAVVTLAQGGEVAAMLRADGVEVLECGGRGGWDVRVFTRLARIMQSRRPRLVHSFLFHANLAVRVAGKLTRYPVAQIICEIQTVEVERKWHLVVDHATHEWCRVTIGNSPSVIEHLHRTAGIPLSRLCLIRGGIEPIPSCDPHSRDAARAAIRAAIPEMSNDAPVVLWVGRLDPVKGLATLVEAFQSVAATTTAHLLLACDGPMFGALQHQITNRGLWGRVHLLGMRRDVPDLLRAADLFVFPSRTEGLPNALLEAMAWGVPVLTTDVPGCRDLVQDGVTGRLVPYDDADALARALLAGLTDRESAKVMARQAQASVESLWQIQRTHANYLALYRSALVSS